MSELLLEKLSRKTTKDKMKPVKIKLDKGQVAVQVKLVRSREDYDINSFRKKLLKRGLQAPKIPTEQIEVVEEKRDVVENPKKIKKIGKTKLPGKKLTI